MAFVCKSISADHKDLIHDVAYDYYGKRMATCSSDHTVKIWSENEEGEWVCTGTLVGHNGPVWKVTWAHSEFSQIIATCSYDRTAAVWEETVGDFGQGVQSKWVRQNCLVDSRSSVTDVKFAPNPTVQGLLLATCSADGIIKIYEAPDVMALYQWTPLHDIPTKLNSCSCLSWNPSLSRLFPPLIAVGSDDPNPTTGGKVAIYEYLENSRKWARVETLLMCTDPVHDLAFSPNLGRSYHLLAIASKDLRIVALKPISREDSVQGSMSSFELKEVAQFDDHGSSVWRVSWNMTGTILSSTGDDGTVRLWKANYLDIWKCISTMKGEEIINDPNADKIISTTPSQHTGRYLKLNPTTHPSQMIPRH